MMTVQEIIDAFPTRSAFGRACGFKVNPSARAHDMRRRGSIPVRYWQGVIDAARDLGRRDITHRVLADAHAPKMEAAE